MIKFKFPKDTSNKQKCLFLERLGIGSHKIKKKLII